MLFNNHIRVTVISTSYYLNKNEIILDVYREKLFFLLTHYYKLYNKYVSVSFAAIYYYVQM